MEPKVILSSLVEKKLYELVLILFKEGYFGFIEDAENYVDRIYDFIQSIPNRRFKNCFSTLYGEFYVRFDNPKSSMQYYITFSKRDNRYLSRNIISPKTEEYWFIFLDN